MKKNEKNFAEDRLVLKIFAFICYIASIIIIYYVFSKDLRLSILVLAAMCALGGQACLEIAKKRNSKNFKPEQDSKQQSSSTIRKKKDRKENFYNDYGYGFLMLLILVASIFLSEYFFDKFGVPDVPFICSNSLSSICSIKYLGDFLRVISNPSNLSFFLIVPIMVLIVLILHTLGLKPPKE